MLKDFSRSSSSASSFASVVEETEGVDADDTGLVRGPGARGALQRPGGRLLGPCRYSGQKHEPGVAEMRSGDSAAKEYCRLPLPYSEALRGSPVSLTERPVSETVEDLVPPQPHLLPLQSFWASLQSPQHTRLTPPLGLGTCRLLCLEHSACLLFAPLSD